MPRDHGRILATIWQDRDFRQRSPEAQRLYMLLLSQPNVNNAGVLPMQITKWAKGCAYTTPEDIQKALDELAEHRYVVYDDDTEEALIRSYMRNDGVMKHPNLVKNALRCVESAESPALREALAEELRRTRRSDAREVADRVAPTDAEDIPSETHSDAIDIPSETHPDAECHSNAISILAGRGKGKGKGEPLVGTQVGESPPSEFCSKHPTGTERSCGGCGAARERRKRWDADTAERIADHRKTFRDEVRKCPECDENGFVDMPPIGLSRCRQHDWKSLDA